MIEKSNKLVYLGEIHDAIYEKELMDERRRTIPDYDNKYNGLNKLFYPMDWFVRISKEYGKKVFFSKVDNPYYINSKYLYNCYIF